MTQNTHTPGPWCWHDENCDDLRPLWWCEMSQGCGYLLWDNDANKKANARLIAAAPDLLEALEEIRDMLWSRPDISDRLRPLMGFAEEATNQKAASAIAKARGQS